MEEERKVLQEEGENIIPITHETCVIDDDGNTVIDKIGDVSLLNTNSRNLVGAINEVFSDTIKQQIIDALINSGIEVNEGESWVSIIDKLKNSGGGGLDIFSATELPITGKEGQICVIMDNPINSFILSCKRTDYTPDKVHLYHEDGQYNYLYETNNISYFYNFTAVACNKKALASYYWENNSWNRLSYASIGLVRNGYYSDMSFTGGIYTPSSTAYTVYQEGKGIVIRSSSAQYLTSFSTANKINMDNINTIKITAYHIGSYGTYFGCYLFTSSTTSFNYQSSGSVQSGITAICDTQWTMGVEGSPNSCEFDVSNITGDLYIGFGGYFGSNTITITDFELY